MSSNAPINFVRQQGFPEASASECGSRVPALMFQPRLVGLIVAIGIVFQAGYVFLALSAALWWSALAPSSNPFEALYNALIASPRGLPPLTPSPAPRRFAQGMAASFALGIGVSLLAGGQVFAWILEGFLVVALSALLFGRFCLGAYVFHVLRGDREFANRTLPWA
jgi:hypothetical protein